FLCPFSSYYSGYQSFSSLPFFLSFICIVHIDIYNRISFIAYLASILNVPFFLSSSIYSRKNILLDTGCRQPFISVTKLLMRTVDGHSSVKAKLLKYAEHPEPHRK